MLNGVSKRRLLKDRNINSIETVKPTKGSLINHVELRL